MVKPKKRDVIVTNSAQISPLQVFGEEFTILANHSQTGSYEVYVHDVPQGKFMSARPVSRQSGKVSVSICTLLA